MEDPLGSGGFAYYLHLVLPSGNTILLAVNVPDPWTAPQVSACLPGQGNWLRAALRGLPKMAGGGGGQDGGRGRGGRPRWRALKMAGLRRWGWIPDPLHGPQRAGSGAGRARRPSPARSPGRRRGSAASPRREALAAAHSDAVSRRDAAGPVLPRPLRLEAGAAPGRRR